MITVKQPRRLWWQRWLLYVAAALLLFEEWLWRSAAAALLAIARAVGLARLEAWLRHLPAWAALLIWGGSLAIVLPFKLAAYGLFATGRLAEGTVVLILAKLAGSALLSWLFQVMRPALLRVRAVRYVRDTLVRWIARAKAWLHAQPAYRYARRQVRLLHQRLRESTRRLMGRRS